MAMYKPRLSLNPDEDGTYTLLSVTETAHGGFSAGAAEIGVPKGHSVPSSAVGVLLHLKHGGSDLYLDGVQPVRHVLDEIELGGTTGKDMVVGYCIYEGRVFGVSSLGLLTDKTLAALYGLRGLEPLESGSWSVWADFLTPGPRMLRIRGSHLAPSPGHRVRLLPVSQAVDPLTLVLEMEVTALPGWWPQLVTPIPVEYDGTYAGIYNKVAINLPLGNSLVFPVRVVS